MRECKSEQKKLFKALFDLWMLLSQKAPCVDLAAAAKSIIDGPMRPFLRYNWQADFQRTGKLFTAGFFLAHDGSEAKDVDRRLLLASVAEGLANLWLDPDWSFEDDGPALRKAIRGYLKLNGVKLAQVESPVAQSERVKLFGQSKEPVVDGKIKDILTVPQYNAIQALVEAGDRGLTKDLLDNNSGHGEARKILKRLSNNDPDWAKVIPFPGTSGKRYKIL